MRPIRLFIGTDEREQVGVHVFCHSVWRLASVPVFITPISHKALSDGTNAFTLSRFLIPYFCGYNGDAIWADGADMLCLSDIAELAAMYDPFKAVQVVKHEYMTKHPIKYLGQKNYDYERKNWSSLMLINCGHFSWRKITPESIGEMSGTELHRFSFMADKHIGELPKEWNYICDEPNQQGPAKIAHFSIGLPVWYPKHEYAQQWFDARDSMCNYKKWPDGGAQTKERKA